MALEACTDGVGSSSEERPDSGGVGKAEPYGCVRSIELRDFLTRRAQGSVEKENGGTETGRETRRREKSVVIERSSTDVDIACGIVAPQIKERKNQWKETL